MQSVGAGEVEGVLLSLPPHDIFLLFNRPFSTTDPLPASLSSPFVDMPQTSRYTMRLLISIDSHAVPATAFIFSHWISKWDL